MEFLPFPTDPSWLVVVKLSVGISKISSQGRSSVWPPIPLLCGVWAGASWIYWGSFPTGEERQGRMGQVGLAALPFVQHLPAESPMEYKVLSTAGSIGMTHIWLEFLGCWEPAER